MSASEAAAEAAESALAFGGGDTIEDVARELGLDDADGAPTGDEGSESPPAVAAKPAAKEKAPAKAKEPEAEAKADKPEADGEKAETEEEAEPDDTAVVRGIMARARARKAAAREREGARIQEPPAQQAKPEAKPAEAAKPTETPASAPARQPSSDTYAAVRDVILAIEKLAGDDAATAETPPATQAEATAAAAERKKTLEGIKQTLDTLAKNTEQGAEMQAQIQKLSDVVASTEQYRQAQVFITRELDAIEDHVPSLFDGEKVREMKRPEGSVTGAPGTRYRNAVDIVHDTAVRFHNKYKSTPDVREIARRIEKKLQALPAAEKTEASPNEKRPSSRKTVSSALGSPPAARTGPDERTSRDAEEDFFKSLNIDKYE